MATLLSNKEQTYVTLFLLSVSSFAESKNDDTWIEIKLEMYDNSQKICKVQEPFLNQSDLLTILSSLEKVISGEIEKYTLPELIEPMFYYEITKEEKGYRFLMRYNADFTDDQPHKKYQISFITDKQKINDFYIGLLEEYKKLNLI